MILNDFDRLRVEIAYCEFGFGPKYPWGLVSSSAEHPNMGIDSDWFQTFLDTIWIVFKEELDGSLTPLTAEGTWASTWELIEELRRADAGDRYHCLKSFHGCCVVY